MRREHIIAIHNMCFYPKLFNVLTKAPNLPIVVVVGLILSLKHRCSDRFVNLKTTQQNTDRERWICNMRKRKCSLPAATVQVSILVLLICTEPVPGPNKLAELTKPHTEPSLE